MEVKGPIEEIINNSKGNVAVVVKNLKEGSSVCINENMVFPSASTIKLLIMCRAIKEIYQGKRKLKDKFILRGIDKCDGDGILKELIDGHLFTLEELITLMIILSDNTATNILIDKIGMDNINDMGKELGLTNTQLKRKMMDLEAVKMGKKNITTARDLCFILEKIYKRELISPEYSDMMLNILKKQQIKHRLNLYLPKDIVIAHKTGELDNLEHDIGIVYHPNCDYIICVLTNNVISNKEGREIIGKISHEVYKNMQ